MNAPVTPAKPTPSISPSASAPKIISPPPFKLGQVQGVGKWLKLLAYSKPGIGKTELVASTVDVEEMNDVLYVDAESGELTVQDNPRIKNWPKLIENRVPVKSFKEVASVHDWLKGHCMYRDKTDEASVNVLRANEARLRGVDVSAIQTPKRFRSIILDSLTEINAYSNYELLGVDEAKVLAGDADSIEVATWDEFRKNNQRIQMLVRAFRDLPIHLMVVCGEQYKQDEQKKFHYEPNLTGQLARQVQAFFDIVGHFQQSKVGDVYERRLYVQPVGLFDAKNRRSLFKADFFKNPNMTMIMKETGMIS